MKDQPESEESATERRLGHLVVPAPDRYEASERIDWIHDPDLELLRGPE
jgi:hypothetical protein